MKSPPYLGLKPIASQILAYLSANPAAEDTLSGITDWWLLNQRTPNAMAEVQKALSELAGRGMVLTRSGPDAGVHYRLNSKQRALIARLLQKKLQARARLHPTAPLATAVGRDEARMPGSVRQDERTTKGKTGPRGRLPLAALAQRLEPKASWTQLALPETQIGQLKQVTTEMRQNLKFAGKRRQAGMNRRHGVSALFAGPGATGKTIAAEVLARDLRLDLYRIDLAAVVSKYTSETEKNLRRLFDAAEQTGAILFFDEADALFAKHSEVKDSNDRYASFVINYLLQRIESYRGLVILATNATRGIDEAFSRRLRVVVEFPRPRTAKRR